MATQGWRVPVRVVGWVVLLGLAAVAAEAVAAETVALRETADFSKASRIVIEMKAEGELRPEAPSGAPSPKPVALTVESRFDFHERAVPGAPAGSHRVVRRVNQAATAINGEVRPLASSIRPEVALLVAQPREGGVLTFSPGGPLTRSELDLVQGPADPLTLGRILPEKPVGLGDTWDLGPEVARSLSDYDTLTTQTLRARLETLDADAAELHLAGEVRGSARGGAGTVTVEGRLRFDRAAGQIRRLDLKRTEVRAQGHVEAGFEFRGTLTLTREPAEVPPELSDPALSGLPMEPLPHLLLLRFAAPDGRYHFLHDRDWHLIWDDVRLAVFKRLDGGEFLAQCNLSVGPDAGAGRHQDPAQFRSDIREALGERFVAFLGDGQISDEASGPFRYRVAVQGSEGDRNILWYYYLIAHPDGRQLLATFVLNAEDNERFGAQDAQLIGTLEWGDRSEGADAK